MGSNRVSFMSLVRSAGPSLVLRKANEQVWSTHLFFGLRCDLAFLPPIRRAKFEISIKPQESKTYLGFVEELKRVTGQEYILVFQRQLMCAAGVQTLYTADGPDGSPAYAQWLITAETQRLLHEHQPKRYRVLAPDEGLLEGAYTFVRYRKTGVMADGMGQLLRIAQHAGKRYVFTYVAADNIPSLRGCADVGFGLDHVRTNIRKLGHFSSVVQSVDEQARKTWSQATTPRPSAS